MKLFSSLLCAALMALALPAVASGPALTGQIGLSNHYIDRGVETSNDPSLNLQLDADGLFVPGVFVSADLNTLDLNRHDLKVRTDYGAGFHQDLGTALDYALSVHHVSHSIYNDGKTYNEARGEVGLRVVPSVRLFVHASQPLNATYNDTYYGGGATYTPDWLDNRLSLTADADFYRHTGTTLHTFNNADFSATLALTNHVNVFGLYSYAHDQHGLHGDPNLSNVWETGLTVKF